MARRISKLVSDGLTGMDLNLSWFTRRIQPLKYNSRLICAYTGMDDSLRVTKDNLPADSLKKRIHTLVKIVRGQTRTGDLQGYPRQQHMPSGKYKFERLIGGSISELNTLHSANKDLESKLKEAEEKQKLANDPFPELEHAQSGLQAKRVVDLDVIKKLQKELKSLHQFMTRAESSCDLLNSNVFDPLGYNEERCELFPCDDLIRLAGHDCKDLVSACRKICYNLALKNSRKCDVR
ncbi:hypothetical protein QYE76_028743 [Lolium multiflorum]|uniref:Uncharacterized protein n=1 Tax=Lolium multiflorum TaxID=4521 RepID=A0AAD8QLI3_LOLMU|nr:hypothetical protein QYE76_028743 [Lolium multiflorum]